MKKILALALPLMFLTLLTIPAGKAVTTPIEVVRANGICYYRMRGDHHTASFLFHYVNLSPVTQTVTLSGIFFTPLGLVYFVTREYTILSGKSIDDVVPGGIEWTFSFYMFVDPPGMWTLTTEVIIPPPPLPVKIQSL